MTQTTQPLLRRGRAADERRRRRRAGVRREFDTMFETRPSVILRDLDLVKREEFEAVKDMARLAREENEALKARIAALGGQALRQSTAAPASPPPPPPPSSRSDLACGLHPSAIACLPFATCRL